MSEPVWVKANRLDDGMVRFKTGPSSASDIHPSLLDEVVPASELQRVTPSLPQTEQEWKQCADERRRAQTGFGAAVDSWHTILGVYGDKLWMTYPDGDGTDTWNCCNVVALDPPWVPEGEPEEVLGYMVQYLDGAWSHVYGSPESLYGGRICRVVAVGDGER